MDQNGTNVGQLTDAFNGTVLRNVGDDAVVFWVTTAGPAPNQIDFYHASADCSDQRYVGITGGSGFAYWAYVSHGTIFYTKTVDPNAPVVDVHAYEHFEPGEDATQAGTCNSLVGSAPLGAVTTVVDPALATLVLPLRVQ